MNDCNPKVLYVIGTLNVGGAEKHLSLLAPRLIEAGFDTTIYCLSQGGELTAPLEKTGVHIHLPPLVDYAPTGKLGMVLRYGLSILKLYALMLMQRPTIVHFFLPASYVMGYPLAVLALRQHVIMSRRSMNDYQDNHPWLTRFERILNRYIPIVLGNSKRVCRQLHEEEGIEMERLGLIYNGINTQVNCDAKFRQESRRQLSLGDDDIAIIIIANLIPYKGHRDLFEALKAVIVQTGSPCKLLVVGRDCGILDELTTYAGELGLNDNIVFLHYRDDIPSLLEAADIGVMASHQEGFSNAVLECMAHGLPMVVTDVGGNPEAVEDKHTGFVVPPRDPAALCAALARLVSDVTLRQRMGEAGRRRVQSCFSIDLCVGKYIALYRAILDDVAINELQEIRYGGERLTQ